MRSSREGRSHRQRQRPERERTTRSALAATIRLLAARLFIGLPPENNRILTDIPWLGWTCGQCAFCRSHRENLCDAARFTGYTLDGGYAEYAVADARFCCRACATGSCREPRF